VTNQPNIPVRGAVDLSALASQREVQQRRSAAMGSAPAGVVVDVTEATFETEVILRSQQVPVVLDLWATWCGPCKTLSPILETLAAEYGGRFVLAKVDVDAEQRIAAAFQVQSIPSVFAVVGGQPVPLFQGALPEPQVRQYIEELLKVAAQAGVTGTLSEETPEPEEESEEPLDPRFAAAYDAIDAGDWAAAQAAYESVLVAEPNNADARAGVALCALQSRLMESVEPTTDLDRALATADSAAADNRWTDAFGTLIGAVRDNAGDDRERARQRLLELFAVAGDDPAVAQARIDLANALF
jgi:putative thioredoxin